MIARVRLLSFIAGVAVGAKAQALTIGPVLNYLHYEEPGVMSDKGFLVGLRMRNDILRAGAFSLYGDLEASYGQTRYDGSISNVQTGEVTPLRSDSRNFIYQSELGARQVIPLGEFGIGFKAGLRAYGLENKMLGPGAYDRSIFQVYAPVSADLFWRVSTAYVLGLRASYAWFLYGRVTSNLAMAVWGWPSVTNFQDSGKAAEAEIFLQPLGNERFSLGVRYSHHEIGESRPVSFRIGEDVTTVTEPTNRTKRYSLFVGYAF